MLKMDMVFLDWLCDEYLRWMDEDLIPPMKIQVGTVGTIELADQAMGTIKLFEKRYNLLYSMVTRIAKKNGFGTVRDLILSGTVDLAELIEVHPAVEDFDNAALAFWFVNHRLSHISDLGTSYEELVKPKFGDGNG